MFKRSHQKINAIIFAYEKIKRIYIENYICNNQAGTPAISKKNKLTLNNPNDEKNLIDMKYILHGK